MKKAILGIIVFAIISGAILLFYPQSIEEPIESQMCLGAAGCYQEKITSVIDGDTIYTDTLKIRLSLTNTPERGEDGFAEATEFTRNLCPVGSVILFDQDDLQKVDVYGRVLGEVWCEGKLLNSELLYAGHANISTRYCSTSEFAGEAWAKEFGC